jgi:hypothetical protein
MGESTITSQASVLRTSDFHRQNPNSTDLFSSYRLGDIALDNRLVMSPMTRSRAVDGNVPNPLAKTYYVQRASAGLIITEATQVSPQGVGYIRTPGLHSPEQVAGRKAITDAVHRVGGTNFAQLWHVGRISHPDFHGGELPVAPSAVAADGEVFTARGKTKMVTPRALETHEIRASSGSSRTRQRTPRGRASTVSNCMARTDTCWTSFCATARTGAPTPMVEASKTARASPSKLPKR